MITGERNPNNWEGSFATQCYFIYSRFLRGLSCNRTRASAVRHGTGMSLLTRSTCPVVSLFADNTSVVERARLISSVMVLLSFLRKETC
jgi:hypothetical protein